MPVLAQPEPQARPQAAPSAAAVHPLTAGPCPVRPVYPLPRASDERQALLHALEAAIPQCLRDAAFYAWRGALQLAQGEAGAAIESLERALLLEPDLPGAQLDYAQALLALGDAASARNLLQQLAARPDVPLALQPLLRQELAASNPDSWRQRWLLSSALGADSNLNNAPAASALTLTFPDATITLPVAEDYRPRGGGSWVNSAQWLALRPDGAQLWGLQAEVRSRATADTRHTGYLQAELNASWLQAPQAPAQWIARVGMGHVEFGSSALFTSLRGQLLRQWQSGGRGADEGAGGGRAADCRPALGAEVERRRYPANTELDGVYLGAVASWACADGVPLPAGLPAVPGLQQRQVTLQLRWGTDRPERSSRPGGIYDRLELRGTWEATVGGSVRLNADYAYARQHDRTGYSPLLQANRPRQSARHALRLEAARPLSGGAWNGAELFMALEAAYQRSNLEAFTSRQRAAFVGLRWQSRP